MWMEMETNESPIKSDTIHTHPHHSDWLMNSIPLLLYKKKKKDKKENLLFHQPLKQ